MKNKIPYGKQSYHQDDIDAVVSVMESPYWTQGPKVLEFEKAFAEYVRAPYAIAVCNGTAALHLSVLALGVQPGQKVLTTPITFSATANAVLYAGGEVEFVDIDPDTYLMDMEQLKLKIESAPKGFYAGIIPVDFAGLPVDTEKIKELADQHGLWILEDACHAPGAGFVNSKGEKILCGDSNYSDLTCFSFHPVKHIACGEGGMVTTGNEKLYKKILQLRSHGITKDPSLLIENHGGWYYEMQELGFNYRIPDLNSALGISQLKRADSGLSQRQKIADIYRKELQKLDLKFQKTPENYFHAYHLFVVESDSRKELYNYFHEKGILAQIHYMPIHLMPYYKERGWKKGMLPVAEKYYERCISIPMYPTLLKKEQHYVITTLKNFKVKL